jgi:hypothetical protein
MNAYFFSMMISFFIQACPDCGCPKHDHYVIGITDKSVLVMCPKCHLDIPTGKIVDFLDKRLADATLTGLKLDLANASEYLHKEQEAALATTK